MLKGSNVLGYTLVASIFAAGVLVGGALAMHTGTHYPPTGRGMSQWNPYKFGASDLVVIFAVDKDGNVEASYRDFGANPGQMTTWQYISPALAELDINIRIGNPKTCWITSSGDKQCVVY
jgi:hypothetical protein